MNKKFLYTSLAILGTLLALSVMHAYLPFLFAAGAGNEGIEVSAKLPGNDVYRMYRISQDSKSLGLVTGRFFGNESIFEQTISIQGNRALLVGEPWGEAQVYVETSSGYTKITDSHTMKRGINWSTDGSQLFFSEAPVIENPETRKYLDEWNVMAVHIDGKLQMLGLGFAPQAVDENSVLALSPAGIVLIPLTDHQQARVILSTHRPPTTDASFVISHDNTKLLWNDPYFKSLTAFTMNINSAVPLQLIVGLPPDTLEGTAISPDGNTFASLKRGWNGEARIVLFDLSGREIDSIALSEGVEVLSLHAWH